MFHHVVNHTEPIQRHAPHPALGASLVPCISTNGIDFTVYCYFCFNNQLSSKDIFNEKEISLTFIHILTLSSTLHCFAHPCGIIFFQPEETPLTFLAVPVCWQQFCQLLVYEEVFMLLHLWIFSSGIKCEFDILSFSTLQMFYYLVAS